MKDLLKNDVDESSFGFEAPVTADTSDDDEEDDDEDFADDSLVSKAEGRRYSLLSAEAQRKDGTDRKTDKKPQTMKRGSTVQQEGCVGSRTPDCIRENENKATRQNSSQVTVC